MSSKKIIRTAWGSKQIAVPSLPELSREKEIMLRQEWKTPSKWIDPAEHLYTAYCNPGFNNMLPWIEKASAEAGHSPDGIVCVLGLCAPSTMWWAAAVNLASEIRLLSPRVQFQAPDPRIPQSSNVRDCALLIFRGFKPDHDAEIVTWRWK